MKTLLIEENIREIQKIFTANNNENTIHDFWNMLRFITSNVYVRK